MLVSFVRQALRNVKVKTPTEVYPLVTIVPSALIIGTIIGARKLWTDPDIRRHRSHLTDY
jgi:hypothetical protein